MDARHHVQPLYGVIYSFRGFPNDGALPYSGLAHVGGLLYGTTEIGGSENVGTVFAITTLGHPTWKASFKGAKHGANPQAGLTNVSGKFYGTSTGGTSTSGGSGASFGTVFTVTPGNVATLHRFKGGESGATPTSDITYVTGTHMFYGTTRYGGTNGFGTVFEISPLGKEKVLYSFKGGSGDGANPVSGLFHLPGTSTLYGTTQYGGTDDKGTVYTITTSGTPVENLLYSFKGGDDDGEFPRAGLIYFNRTLYGTTENGGGPNDAGTVYEISTSGSVEHVIHRFSGSDGRYPVASLIQLGGMLYGTTASGGTHGVGTVFAISPSPSGQERVLYSFGSRPHDGAGPQRRLVNVDGVLYGTTTHGGKGICPGNGCGTVFSIAP